MNRLLQVKMPFTSEKNTQTPGSRNLRKGNETSVEKIDKLSADLKAVLLYYKGIPKIIDNIIIDVNYNDIIAKSNRIVDLLKPTGKSTNDMVVGARFSAGSVGEENHIITYYIDVKTISKTLDELEVAKAFLTDKLSGKAVVDNFNEPLNKLSYEGYSLSKSKLRNLIVDCSVVSSFSVPKPSYSAGKDSVLITFYKTEIPLATLLEKLQIDERKYPYYFYGEDSISVTKDLYEILTDRVPYLISMISSDISKIAFEKSVNNRSMEAFTVPLPAKEPVIGVIDTLFDENVYFKEWVENIDYLDDEERYFMGSASRDHGTEVTSLIVDGPQLNPWLEDGCGRFRVKHFGVCIDKISPARLIRKIKEIVSNNPEIHVWNLSLGTEDEISKNFISYDAAMLDELQVNKNIIFVVSGTNDNRKDKKNTIKIGSPADSLNAVVVNSVKRNGSPASYSRQGNVLSFFNKPDVAYYGGDFNERIKAYSSNGEVDVFGTSFAAPWISRKLSYLIDVMGLSREVAKAIILDAAAGWEYKKATYKIKNLVGYGVVPVHIQDILSTKDEEFKFMVYGTASSYKTVNYAIPIPKDENGNYPYVARAILCYFPRCSRNQGVDYTNRELSIKFGRVDLKGVIKDINDNVQDDSESYIDERKSREEFRKWENSKFISKIFNRNKPLQSYKDRLWGLSLISKERLKSRTEEGLNFGIVITLRELFGVNRIQDFVKACSLRGWIVEYLNVNHRLELYNTNQEEVKFE
ncbi:S8 family peptidase [Candidatus Proelusimicrobium volucris]|uniref:S8 family peptidase n=1 Tax=Candidatus Proelusimicrobium volucris TaxID=3416225 RepID=UPI003D13CB2B